MTKIQIAVPRKDKEALLQFLQEEEVIHIAENEESAPPIASDTAYQLAQVQFGLEFVDRIRRRLNEYPKRSLKTMFSSKPAATLPELELRLKTVRSADLLLQIQKSSDELVELDGKVTALSQHISSLTPWQALRLRAEDLGITVPVEHALVSIITHEESYIYDELSNIPTSLWQEVGRIQEGKQVRLYGEVIVHKKDAIALQKFLQMPGVEQVELAINGSTFAEELQKLRKGKTTAEEKIQQILKGSRQFLTKEDDLKFAYDALLHQQERENVEQHMAVMDHSVVLTGWLPKPWLASFSKRTSARIADIAISEVPLTKQDIPPVALTNRSSIRPFEVVTNIYGKPAYHEIDPTPALSIFFLLAFGLALTDAGYGLVMVVSMFAAERFFRLKKEMRKMVRLLCYGGISTTILGALTGGWFSIDLNTLPAGTIKDVLLGIKVIDPIAQPMVLLGVALGLGILQLLTAWGVRGYYNWKQGEITKVLVDDLSWITMVVFLLGWIAAKQQIIPAGEDLLRWAAIANATFLVVTQGRSYKNPLLKLGSGAISLYGLVSFLSDTLSYSRLLALGLATGIIGLVVNLVASLAFESVPVVGILLGIGVLLVGHIFNLGINALGAFIHSGRLQFVEFFPKFIEGGGVPYMPFGRISHYVDNPREFA
ncbi:MAG: hypothetical protein HYR90_03920 [Candidatus Andersenbacteria bacterium]|nr:hypothetical protein [Candidatus Andersenbacteria bacterium]MBI3250406.1 hypothetical protein [Candidatus Andersenbacteria bacterium]